MKHRWIEKLKWTVRPTIYRLCCPRKPTYACPICGYRGPFKDKHSRRAQRLVRVDSKCVRCGAAERHRMLFMVLKELQESEPNAVKGRVLHFAPEPCLKPLLQSQFEAYETADLFMPGVDHREDIQQMSFEDGRYDCIVISHVMTSIPDVATAVAELRRITAPGGRVVFAEPITCDQTVEFEAPRSELLRELGVDFLGLVEGTFDRVDRYLGDRYDARWQLVNRIRKDGEMCDDYPELVRAEGAGYLEFVCVAYA